MGTKKHCTNRTGYGSLFAIEELRCVGAVKLLLRRGSQGAMRRNYAQYALTVGLGQLAETAVRASQCDGQIQFAETDRERIPETSAGSTKMGGRGGNPSKFQLKNW